MSYRCELSGDAGVLAVSGTQTIEDAPALKAALVEALGAVRALEIDLGEATALDLCCQQVLCSAHRTAAGQGKVLAIRHPDGRLRQDVRETGYLRHVGCMQAGGQECLWAEADGEKADTGK